MHAPNVGKPQGNMVAALLERDDKPLKAARHANRTPFGKGPATAVAALDFAHNPDRDIELWLDEARLDPLLGG